MSKSIRSIIAPDGKAYLFDNEAFKKCYKRHVDLESIYGERSKEDVKIEFQNRIYKSESTIKNWLAGRNGVDTYDTVALIAKVLHVSPYQLLIEQKKQNKGTFSEPSVALAKAFEAMVMSFDKHEIYCDLDYTLKNVYSANSRESLTLYYVLPISNELRSHNFDIIVAIDLFFKTIDEYNLEGAGARVYLLIEYGGNERYVHNIGSFSNSLGEWEVLLNKMLQRCDMRLEMADSELEDVIYHRIKYEEIEDKYSYRQCYTVKQRILSYLSEGNYIK